MARNKAKVQGQRQRAKRDDVCRACGVSSATVSRVLNNKPGVGSEVRQKVLAAARDLNYVPQAAARHLSQARTDTVGIVFQDLTPGWFLTIFRGIVTRCSGVYDVLNSLSVRSGDELELPKRMLAERRVDGLIWLDQRVSPRMISRIRELGVPVVLIQMPNDDPRTSSVCIETRDGSADAVRHLLELGYKRIALVTGPKGAVDSDYKLAGAMRAFREFGIEIPSHDILEGHHLASFAVKAIGERFATRPRPDAIFAFNDEMAIAIVLWLREQGFRVPEDVAVVGFDGIPEARLMGLTTVETPLYDMGVVAAQLLIEAIKSPASHQNARQVVLKGQLCIRETCGAKLKQARIRPSPPA